MTHRDQLPSNRPRERGAVLAYVAVALIGLMAFSALVIDMGVLWVGRRQTQNAADAGALAGAISLAFGQPPADYDDPNDPAYVRAKTEAAVVAQSNRAWGSAPRVIAATDVQIISCPEPIPDMPDRCVRVNAYRNQEGGTGNAPLPTFFARLVGVDEQGARATATAQIYRGITSACLKPFAIPDLWWVGGAPGTMPGFLDTFTPGTDAYVRQTAPLVGSGYGPRHARGDVPSILGRFTLLKAGNPHDAIHPGWFFPFDFAGSVGGDDFRDNIATCNPWVITLNPAAYPPATVVNEPGNMIGPTAQGIGDLIDQDPNGQFNCVYGGACSAPVAGPGVCPTGTNCIDGHSPRWVPIPVFDPEMWNLWRNNGRYELPIVDVIGMWVDGLWRDVRNTALGPQFLAQNPGFVPDTNDVVARFYLPPASGRGSRDGNSSFLRTVVLVR